MEIRFVIPKQTGASFEASFLTLEDEAGYSNSGTYILNYS